MDTLQAEGPWRFGRLLGNMVRTLCRRTAGPQEPISQLRYEGARCCCPYPRESCSGEDVHDKAAPACVSVGEDLHVFGVVKHTIHTLR